MIKVDIDNQNNERNTHWEEHPWSLERNIQGHWETGFGEEGHGRTVGC